MAVGERPLKLAVLGLWHLGTVTAACLAAEGHMVIAIDDATIVAAIQSGKLPVDEPGLADLIQSETAAGRLTFASDASAAAGAELLWVCYDTPVDDDDRPDVAFVVERVAAFLNAFPGSAVVAVSSQLPVGSVAGTRTSLSPTAAFGSHRFRRTSVWVLRSAIFARRIASLRACAMSPREPQFKARSGTSRRRSFG